MPRPLTADEHAALMPAGRARAIYVVITLGGDIMPADDSPGEGEQFYDLMPAWLRAVELTERGWPCQVVRGRGVRGPFRIVAEVARLGVRAHPLASMPAEGCA